MSFLFNKNSHFNLANLATFGNIAAGVLAIYFITHSSFFAGALFAWIGGAFDLIDGKIARKYKLSTQFGIQLDSYADFLSFVIVPPMFIYFAIFNSANEINIFIIFVVFVYYIISGLRRLIQFNIEATEGDVQKHFIGVPTPLGGILLFCIYLLWLAGVLPQVFVLLLVVIVGFALNSKIKIKHL